MSRDPVCRRTVTATIKSAGDRRFTFRASTSGEGLMGDTVEAAGWQIDGPVPLLWNHDHSLPPLGRAMARAVPQAAALDAEVQFVPPGVYPFADQVHDLVAGGFVTQCSV